MSEEEYRDIPGWEGVYAVSRAGRILSIRRGRLLSNRRPNGRGYITNCLQELPRKQTVLAHRCVALAWIPEIDGKPDVNHINGNKMDNRIENLEWCTQIENVHHSIFAGLRHEPRGENHYRTKMTREDALNIFHATGTLVEIGRKYGVCFQAVSDIKRKKNWKCLWVGAA